PTTLAIPTWGRAGGSGCSRALLDRVPLGDAGGEVLLHALGSRDRLRDERGHVEARLRFLDGRRVGAGRRVARDEQLTAVPIGNDGGLEGPDAARPVPALALLPAH